jgi:hypothetical protein
LVNELTGEIFNVCRIVKADWVSQIHTTVLLQNFNLDSEYPFLDYDPF